MSLSYKTIEEVWDWRKKAYGKLENLPVEDRIKAINQTGSAYVEKLKLKTLPVKTKVQ